MLVALQHDQLLVEIVDPGADGIPIPVISFCPNPKKNTQPKFQSIAR
jgi:hypothetical protein